MKFKMNNLNKLADFITETLLIENKSIIRIIDFTNFIVIKGLTTSCNILDLTKILDDFKLKCPQFFSDRDRLNTIDLIEYCVDVEIVESASKSDLFTASQQSHGYNV